MVGALSLVLLEQEDIVYGRSVIISAARARGHCVW